MEENKKNIKYINLKGFRIANDLGQKQIAEYLDVSIAFISAVERGAAKLPYDKLEKLLENDQQWETAPLLGITPGGAGIHNDHRQITGNTEGEFYAPVTNNHFNGYSQEDFEKELQQRLALYAQDAVRLKEIIADLRRDLAFERARYDQLFSYMMKQGCLPSPSEDDTSTNIINP